MKQELKSSFEGDQGGDSFAYLINNLNSNGVGKR